MKKGKPLPGTKTTIWNTEIEITRPFSGKEKQFFFHLLSILLDSGLSITESLEVIEAQTKVQKSRQIINEILSSLNDGKSLSESMESHAGYFTRFETYSIRMGERSGQVVRVLDDLALYHEKREKLKKKLLQALSYPMVVIVIAGGVLFFMMNFVVPMFSDIFARFDAELPAITTFVIELSGFSSRWGIWIIFFLTIAVIAVWRYRETDAVRKFSAGLLLKVPILSGIVMKVQLSRFCYTFSLMLKSKVNLDQTLELMEQVTTFWPLQQAIPSIRKDVVEGKTLYEAVSQHAIFPRMMIQMVRVGEKTAKLDTMMERLARNLEEEGESGISTLTSLLEPMLIVVIGLMVGIILVSMYLPMFELSNTIGA